MYPNRGDHINLDSHGAKVITGMVKEDLQQHVEETDGTGAAIGQASETASSLVTLGSTFIALSTDSFLVSS